MALVLNERVKETTTTTGTGALSLGGASDGFETFAAGIGNSNTTYYAIFHLTANEFEVGLGTLDSDSSDLTRTTIYASSNSDSAVNFSAGTKTVFCTMPAARSVFLDADGDVTLGANLDVGGNLVVTGTTTFNGGTLTLGDANTDNIVFGGEVDSNIIPDDDNTYDLGSSSKEWKDLYIDGVAYVDAINFAGTAISATAAELNILDGVTSTAAELNILDGVTSTAAELNILDGVTASATDINLIDGITNGTVIASKAIITDSNKDITGGRNITISGELDAATLDISGDIDVDGTTNLDVVDIDGAVDMASTLAVTGVVTANAGVVVDNITIDGTEIDLSSGDLTLDAAGDIVLDSGGNDIRFLAAGTEFGRVFGSSNDFFIQSRQSDKDMKFQGIDDGSAITALLLDMSAAGAATFNDKITAVGTSVFTNLDISGDVDIDGTLEADAITVNGTALASVIAGTTVTLASTVTVTDSTANTNFPVVFHDESNALLDDTGALRYNPSTGELLVPKLTVAGTTTTVDTVTMNASNAIIFEGATADAHETTLTIIDPTGDRTINLPNVSGTIPVLAAVSTTQITSTPEELNILDGVTSTAAELNLVDGITAGTVSASLAVIVDSNKDITGFRNVTTTGVITANAGVVVDNITIDGTEIDLSSGDLTLDVAADIILDSDAANWRFKDAGTAILEIGAGGTGGGPSLFSAISDADMVFKGNDGGSAITALTLDMSDAGTATFNHDILLGDEGTIRLGDSQDLLIYHDNTHSYVQDNGSGQLRIKSNGTAVQLIDGSNNLMINAQTGSSVELWHNTAKKFETASGGVSVTGEVAATSLDISGDADIDGTLEADAITINGTSTDTLYASPGFAVAMAIAL